MSNIADEILDVEVTIAAAASCTLAPAVPPRPPLTADAEHLVASWMWLEWFRETSTLAEPYVTAVLREYIASIGCVAGTQTTVDTCTSVCLGALYRMGVAQEIEAEVSLVLPHVWDRESGSDIHVALRPTATLSPVISAAARRLLQEEG